MLVSSHTSKFTMLERVMMSFQAISTEWNRCCNLLVVKSVANGLRGIVYTVIVMICCYNRCRYNYSFVSRKMNKNCQGPSGVCRTKGSRTNHRCVKSVCEIAPEIWTIV